jgi:hypothetical protein
MSEQVERLKELLKVAKALPLGANRRLIQKMRVRWDQGAVAVEKSCGTSACLIGFAALTPYFMKNGLRYDKTLDHMVDELGEYMGIRKAGMNYFGLTELETDSLFFDSGPARTTKGQLRALLIRRIRTLIKKYSATG